MNDRKEDPAGILVVDKEKGMTSHDVVDVVRRRFAIKKVGHAGTLDPNATGVLVILLGRATKLSGTFLNEDKEYEARMRLGERTDSGDCMGKVVETREVRVSAAEINAAVNSFKGDSKQVPPMVSAKKVKGKRLYKLARKGVEVERVPVSIRVERIGVSGIDLPIVNFSLECSKGTYVRQLAHDIGEKLGCGAHLTELRRTRSGGFTIGQSVSFSELMKMDGDTLDENIIRI
jgi:tRNA pseudouridine55 synthase